MCLISMKILQNMFFFNLFIVFFLECLFCNWFEIFFSCVVEFCVIVVIKKMDNYFSVLINGLLVWVINYLFSDYYILEIVNLQNGLYFLNVINSVGLVVYVFDRDWVRFYYVFLLNQNKCFEFVKFLFFLLVNNGDDKVNFIIYSSVMILYLLDDDILNIFFFIEKLIFFSGNYLNNFNIIILLLYNLMQKKFIEESVF